MKFSTKPYPPGSSGWLMTGLFVMFLFYGCKKWNEPPAVLVTTVASGLMNPMGIESDDNGNLWVSEGETFNNDGKVWVIKPNGKKYPAIIHLSAFTNAHSGEPQGTSHLLLRRGILYVLSGNYLYSVDVSKFKPGDTPIDAAKLPYEDVGKYMTDKKYPDTHPYNLTVGPNGDLYIADAGANAIIHRHGYNKFSVLADLAGFTNPNPAGPPPGPPVVEAVPTSVWWDGHDFLVTTLTGFPFVKGLAVIYRVSLSGKVSFYQKGFTELVDLAEGQQGHHIAVQYSTFGATGFDPNTGALLWVNGNTSSQLVGGLNMPVGIKQHNNHTWFVTCMGDGVVKKVTY